MSDRFTSALLAALNESAEMKDSDTSSAAAAPHEDAVDPLDTGPAAAESEVSENKFAAIISSCMAKFRSGRGTS